jgi:inner membrane protein
VLLYDNFYILYIMTGRTHDLAAFTAMNIFIATQTLPKISLSTAVVAFGANMIGGLMPDIDDATSEFWQQIRAGTVIGKIIHPLLGHHRMISHSIIGMIIAGFLLKHLLNTAHQVILVDMDIVWWSIMIGYLSHLIMDSLTVEGVPWFFPIPIRIGFPPVKFMRIKTGGLIEKIFVFPGLLLFNGYLFYKFYYVYLIFIKTFSK